MDGNGDGDYTKSRTELLLRASQHFLQNRNFKGCRKYALQAAESDPENILSAIAAAQILAISDVLGASTTLVRDGKIDWYAVLGLTRYSDDPRLTRDNFKRLASLLNPNKNKFIFAEEAFGILREAWSVLSDDSKKTQFDNVLRIFESQGSPENLQEKMEGKCGVGESTFWTVCPYCYYVYEYNSVYEECCMRCQNQNCGRGFQAVAIQSPPPEAVVRNGHYWCLGFRSIGFDGEREKRLASWAPFAPLFMGHGVPIETEDDEDSVIDDDLNSKNAKAEEVKQGTEGPSMVKPVAKRIKSVAKRSKKIMGKGNRIRKGDTVPGYFEELESDTCASKDVVSSGFAEEQDFGSGGVQFFQGEDDIFVGVEDDL